MLSAALERLISLRSEINSAQRMLTIELCASAFPDIRQWQVKNICSSQAKPRAQGLSEHTLQSLYYTYLSLLLHPMDGHDIARRDPALVLVS
jgi:hypothetical protein